MNTLHTKYKIHGPFIISKLFNWNMSEHNNTLKNTFVHCDLEKHFTPQRFFEVCSITKEEIKDYDNKSKLNPLNQLFLKYGCNKGTAHNYPSFYSELLYRDRDIIKVFVEIGIGSPNQDGESRMGKGYKYGSSLRGWRDFFPNANIIGCDIDPRVLIEEERISCQYLDQTNPSSFLALQNVLLDKGGADIILDDGLHTHPSNITSLLLLWPYIKPGGVYMIEDMSNEIFHNNLSYIRKLNLNATCYGIELDSAIKSDNRIIALVKHSELIKI
jgi:hypothetical protein